MTGTFGDGQGGEAAEAGEVEKGLGEVEDCSNAKRNEDRNGGGHSGSYFTLPSSSYATVCVW